MQRVYVHFLRPLTRLFFLGVKSSHRLLVLMLRSSITGMSRHRLGVQPLQEIRFDQHLLSNPPIRSVPNFGNIAGGNPKYVL